MDAGDGMDLVRLADAQSPHELLDLLGHADPMVRWQAAESLAHIAKSMQTDRQPFWARTIGRGGALDVDRLVESLGQALESDDSRVRTAVVDALGAWQHVKGIPLVRRALRDASDDVRTAAATALGRCADVDSAEELMLCAQEDSSVWVRAAAIDALGALGQTRVAPKLREMLEGVLQAQRDGAQATAEHLIVTRIVSAMGHLDHGQARAVLMHYAEQDDDLSLRWMAARGLERVGGSEALVVLDTLLEDETAFFGSTIGQTAGAAASAIRKREQGLGAWVRQIAYRISRGVRRLVARLRGGPDNG